MEQYLPGIDAAVKELACGIHSFKAIPTDIYFYENMLFNRSDDRVFCEMYKQLEKYIEPLKRMIASIAAHDVEKITKLTALLDIICNPSKRVPLETLMDYEPILEKIVYFYSGSIMWHPVLNALKLALGKPNINHALNKTFSPTLEFFHGSGISTPTPAKQVRLHCEQPEEVPHVLQGEIVQLDQKFKVSLDTSAPNKKDLTLICYLDDKRLPCVPPINVTIPEKYPFSSVNCSLIAKDYSVTPFLLGLRNIFSGKIAALPTCYSLTHLLYTWEMSIRQACSANTTVVNDLSAIFGM